MRHDPLLGNPFIPPDRASNESVQALGPFALAYEQRTMAMVEFYKTIKANGARDKDTEDLRETIVHRLGLRRVTP